MEKNKFELVQAQNRIRAKRFYNANKLRIVALKKVSRDAKKVIIPPKNSVVPVVPVVPVAPAYDEESIIKRIESFETMNPLTMKKKIQSIKVIFNVYPSDNLMNSVNNFDEMKLRLDNARQIKNPLLKYSPESTKVITQSILWAIMNLPIPVNPEIFAKYENLVRIMTVKSIEHKESQKNNIENSVLSYQLYMDKIKSAFGVDSIQYLIASIYNIITCRDDIASLVIISNNTEAITDNTNYLILPQNGDGTIILQEYKTSGVYKKLSFPLSSDLTTLIKRYVVSQQLTTHLFPKNVKGGLSKLISSMNKKIGIIGGINVIRRMKITSFLKTPNLTVEDKVNFATSCQHSPQMLEYYNYIQKEDDEDEYDEDEDV
jgi:hypothetical protein